jgi:predicted acyltransferase
LGRIGLAWMFAALIFMNTKRNGRIIWFAGILIVYWLVLALVQAPDFPDAARFSKEGNFACYIERMFLPGRMYEPLHDVSGLSGTIPAIATALLGMITGAFVKTSKEGLTQMKKVGCMTVAGIGLVLLGLLWGLIFPINKPLWSSSYVCFAGGLSLLFFALFYWIIDVRGYRRWTFFFTVIGLNSITIYMAQSIINFRFTANYLFGGLIKLFPENWDQFLNNLSLITVCWFFLYFLYRQKIFIKV